MAVAKGTLEDLGTQTVTFLVPVIAGASNTVDGQFIAHVTGLTLSLEDFPERMTACGVADLVGGPPHSGGRFGEIPPIPGMLGPLPQGVSQWQTTGRLLPHDVYRGARSTAWGTAGVLFSGSWLQLVDLYFDYSAPDGEVARTGFRVEVNVLAIRWAHTLYRGGLPVADHTVPIEIDATAATAMAPYCDGTPTHAYWSATDGSVTGSATQVWFPQDDAEDDYFALNARGFSTVGVSQRPGSGPAADRIVSSAPDGRCVWGDSWGPYGQFPGNLTRQIRRGSVTSQLAILVDRLRNNAGGPTTVDATGGLLGSASDAFGGNVAGAAGELPINVPIDGSYPYPVDPVNFTRYVHRLTEMDITQTDATIRFGAGITDLPSYTLDAPPINSLAVATRYYKRGAFAPGYPAGTQFGTFVPGMLAKP